MAHYPGYVPMNAMMMHQPYMVALRFPAGVPPSAAGQQYLQGLQGVPVTLGQTSGVPPHLSGTPLQAGVTFSAAALSQSMTGGIPGGVPGIPGTLSAIPGGLAGIPGFPSGAPVSMASMAGAMGTMGTMGMTMTGIPVSASAQGLLGTPAQPSIMTVAHTPTPPLADSLPQGFAQPMLTPHVSSDRKRKLDEARSPSLLGLPAQHLQMHIPIPLPQEEIEYDPDAPNVDETMVVLDHYNSDLYLALDSDGFGAKPLTEPSGFCFCWAGARATYGVTRAKAYYEVNLVEEMPVDFGDDHQETDPYIIRVGWSIDQSSFQLGEEPYSYGYGGTGKFSTNNKFTNYGERFGVGDVIGAMLDLDSRPPSLSFTKNGRWLGVAAQLHNYPINKREMALFPHILTKNTRFEVNFGQQAPWFPPPHGFLYMQQYPLHERVRGLTAPNKKSDCEMMMIIGLPGAGKTTWGKTMERDHPEKRYNIIGTDTLIDKMKVMGLPRKNNYHGRWDVLIDKATKCLNKMFEIASRRKRNYILDQTNVYPSARRRKMKNFKGFIRKAAIIQPDDTELSRRSDKRTYEDGKYVPEDAVLEMKANFKLPPENDENFDVIEFVELSRDKAQVLVEQYNKEGQSKRPPSANRQGGNAAGFNKNNDRFKPPSDLRQGTQQYQQQPGQPQGTQQKPPLPPNPYGIPLTHGSLQPPPPPPSDQSQYGRDRWGQQISHNEPSEKRARYDPSGGSALDFIKQEYSGDADQSADQIREQHSDWQHTGAPQQDSRIKTEAPWKPTAGGGGGGQYQGQYGGYGYAGQYEGQTYIAQGDPGAYATPKQQTLQQQSQTGNYGQQKTVSGYGEQKQSQSGGFSNQSQNQGGSYGNQGDKWQSYQQKQMSEQESWGMDRKPAMSPQNQGQGQQKQDSGKDNRWPAPGQPGFDYAAAAYGQAPSHAKGSQQQQPQNQWPNWKQETGGQNRSSSGQGGGQNRPISDQGGFGGNKPQNYGNKQESSYLPASQPPSNNFQQQNRNPSQNQFNVSQGNFRPQSGNDRSQSNNQRQSDKQGESGQPPNRFSSANQFSQTSNSSQYSGYGNSKSQFNSPPPPSSQSQVQGSGQEDKPKRDRRRPSKWDTPDEAETESTATPEERQQDFQNVLNSIRSKIATQQQPDPDTTENSNTQEDNSNVTTSQTTDQKEEPPSDKGQSIADSEGDDKDKQDIDNQSPQNQQQGGQGPKGQFAGSGRGRGRGGFDRGGRGGGRGGPRPFGPRNSGDQGVGPRGPGAMGGLGMGPQGGGPRQGGPGMGLQGPGMGLTGPGMGPGHGPRPFNPRPGPAMGPGLRGPPPLFQMRGPGGPRGPPGGMGGPPGGPGGPRGRFQRPMGPQRWPRNH